MAMSSDDNNRTVFVGNLDPLVKDEILYELFLQAGPVRKVTLARDREGLRRPFGFVLYKHAEAVPYAISLLNGIPLYGRPLKLAPSTAGSQHQDAGSSFGSPGAEDRGHNTIRRRVGPQNSPMFNFGGFFPFGDPRSHEQMTASRNAVFGWSPFQLPPISPLSHPVAPQVYPNLFTSTPLLPTPRPPKVFWTPPVTPTPQTSPQKLPAPTVPPVAPEPPPQEKKRKQPTTPPKERETKRKRIRGTLLESCKERAKEQKKLQAPSKEIERVMKRHEKKRMRSRKHRHRSTHKI